MREYTRAGLYIESKTTMRAKIKAIDAIINKLEEVALVAAESGYIEDYSLDDGQTKIKAVYRTAEQVEASIQAFERRKQRLINKVNGRTSRGVPEQNMY